MPSEQHEGLVELFAASPELALTALRDWLRIDLPHWTEVETVDTNANRAQPLERRADLAHVLSDGGKPVLAVVVEVQRQVDDTKRWSWPYYAATMSARYCCQSVLLVVTPSRRVARWAADPLDTGPRNVFWPVVLGPSEIPHIADPSADPEVLILSATAHARSDPAILKPVLDGLDRLDLSRRHDYGEALLRLAAPAVRKELIRMLKERDYPVDDWAKRQQKIGEERGERRGEARILTAQIATLFGGVPPHVERRLREAEPVDLERWATRLVKAQSLDDVFTED
jgi:hypothetical protein